MTQDSDNATLGRSLARWVGWTTIAMLVGIGGTVLAVTGSVRDAVIVGAFGAGWGGPAFGAMFGAGAHSIREDDLAKKRGEIGAHHARIG